MANLHSNVKQQLGVVVYSLPIRNIANTYFNRSASWLYQKLDGIDGNGGVGGFTDDELQILKGALCDLADRIRTASDKL